MFAFWDRKFSSASRFSVLFLENFIRVVGCCLLFDKLHFTMLDEAYNVSNRCKFFFSSVMWF